MNRYKCEKKIFFCEKNFSGGGRLTLSKKNFSGLRPEKFFFGYTWIHLDTPGNCQVLLDTPERPEKCPRVWFWGSGRDINISPINQNSSLRFLPEAKSFPRIFQFTFKGTVYFLHKFIFSFQRVILKQSLNQKIQIPFFFTKQCKQLGRILGNFSTKPSFLTIREDLVKVSFWIFIDKRRIWRKSIPRSSIFDNQRKFWEYIFWNFYNEGRIWDIFLILLFTIENPSLNPPFFKIVPPGIWEKKEKYLPLKSTAK